MNTNVAFMHRYESKEMPDGSDSEIYIMGADGKNQERLTNNDYIDFDPVFTPDGKKIVFTGQRETLENLGIYLMDLEKTFTREKLIERVKEQL